MRIRPDHLVGSERRDPGLAGSNTREIEQDRAFLSPGDAVKAALDLGAKPRTALFKVVIPQILSGMISGFSLAVTLSLDDYFIATYTKPATFDTISTYVVNATKGSQTQIKTALWALSTLIFLLVIVIVLVMNINARRTAQKEERV